MSEEEMIEYVASHTGQSRRKFLERLLVGAAFAVPVIASFSIGGAASAKRSNLEAGALPDCGPNSIDIGGNTWLDIATNTLCDPDGGSNTTTTTTEVTPTTASPTTTTTTPAPVTTTTAAGSGGSVTTTTGLGSGAGTAPGEIPATK